MPALVIFITDRIDMGIMWTKINRDVPQHLKNINKYTPSYENEINCPYWNSISICTM